MHLWERLVGRLGRAWDIGCWYLISILQLSHLNAHGALGIEISNEKKRKGMYSCWHDQRRNLTSNGLNKLASIDPDLCSKTYPKSHTQKKKIRKASVRCRGMAEVQVICTRAWSFGAYQPMSSHATYVACGAIRALHYFQLILKGTIVHSTIAEL